MKKAMYPVSNIFALSFLMFIFQGCQDRIYQTYEVDNPVYLSWEDLRSSVVDTLPEEISQPGKIYIIGNWLLVNEFNKGIHVINDADPAHPEIISFINIPGNVDMAVKDNILYADSYVDLVALDISDMENVKEVARFEDVFNYSLPPYESNSRIGAVDQTRGVVVDWVAEKVTEEVKQNEYYYPVRYWEYNKRFAEDGLIAYATNSVSTGPGSTGTGTGGSMARFIIYKDILYTIDQYNLYLFNVSDPVSPVAAGTCPVSWNIETVFIARDHLFIGSTTGMNIYSLADPYEPEWKSTYWHVTSCDPVVVEGDYAYVTLRTGNTCQTDVNQLDIVNVEDLAYPYHAKSYPMTNPHGLGIDNSTLFICDGNAGLKVYDASNPYELNAHMLAHFPEISTFDVIPYNHVLIMIGEDGLYQYDYTNVTNITLLSSIPIYGE